MAKKILKILVIIFLPFCLQLFAMSKNKMRSVKEIVIDYEDEDMYVTDESVRRTIFKDPQAQHPLGLLKLDEIEQLLDNNDMIEKSEVYFTIDGVLNAKIKQREPIARVFEGNNVCYMDTQGKKMPLSKSFSARVPLLRGESNKYWQPTHQLMLFIQNDPWLKENITEVVVKPNGEYEFLMRVARFKVLFGKFEDEKIKKANLKAFYKQLEETKKLNEYNSISLKYMNQVICKRELE
nr:cell division protein FtsQ [uncultured Capnocytophaga sp.]